MKNYNFNFDLSVSLQTYLHKEDADLTQKTGIRYTPQTISLDYLRILVKQGHWFCHIFNTENNPFGTGEKKNENFNHAQMIFFDVDDSKISMTDFLAKCTKHPSICYNTANNEKNGLYRFRLGYLLESPIFDKDYFSNVYDGIKDNIILRDFPQIKTYLENDPCGSSAAQQFAGNANGNDNCMIFHNKFSFDEIFPNKNHNVSSSFFMNLNGKKTDNPKTKKTKENTNPKNENNKVLIEKGFYNDFMKMNDLEIIEKYKDKYPYFDKSDIEFNDDGFAILDDDYLEIKRTWNTTKTYQYDGTIKYNTKRLHDKEKRRKKLYMAAMVMKQILPTITPTHLLYNLVCEVKWYYDNSDGIITKTELQRIALHVGNKPIEEIKMQKGTNKKFVISKKWCRENDTKPNAQKMKVRKILNFQKIGEIYDVSLSVKDNLKIFKELGIKTSKNSLYRFCKENNISTKGEK